MSSNITAVRRSFTAYRNATEKVTGLATAFVLTVIQSMAAGYDWTGASGKSTADTLGLLGGRENGSTAPLRSRLIGSTSIVTLVAERIATHGDAEAMAWTPEELTALGSFFHGNMRQADVRSALGLATEEKVAGGTPDPEKAGEGASEATEPVTGMHTVGSLTNGEYVALVAKTLKDLGSRTLTVKQAARVETALVEALATLQVEADTSV